MNVEVKKSNKDKDLILVRRAKRGDYKAFDLLVLKYQSRIIGLAMKFVKDIQTAEDVAQESFIKAYKSLDSFREESAFYTWLYRIASNTSKNYLISKKRKNDKEYINKNYPVLQNTNEVEAPMVSQMMSNLKMIKEADEQLSDFDDEESKDSIEINNNNDG
jgi:RNA polymerase sigma factor (sigma-70 family)